MTSELTIGFDARSCSRYAIGIPKLEQSVRPRTPEHPAVEVGLSLQRSWGVGKGGSERPLPLFPHVTQIYDISSDYPPKTQELVAPIRGKVAGSIASPGVVPIATVPPELSLNIDMSMFVHRKSRPEWLYSLSISCRPPSWTSYLRSHGAYRYEL
jgi:hypothetical protein